MMTKRQKQAAERRLKRAFDALLKECVVEALARGTDAKDVHVYFESEAGLVVLNGEAHDGPSAHARQDRVLFSLPWPDWMKGHVDVGAW